MNIFTNKSKDNCQRYNESIKNLHIFKKQKEINKSLLQNLINAVNKEYSDAFLDYIIYSVVAISWVISIKLVLGYLQSINQFKKKLRF